MQLEDKALEAATTAFIKELVSESKGIFKGLYSEAKAVISKDISKYLQEKRKKYETVKTLLHGSSPVALYEIYFPLKLVDSKQSITKDNLSEIFENYHRIIIIGDAGSGKSTLVKHLFLSAIAGKFAIPVLVELRNLNETTDDLESFIYSTIFEDNITDSARILEKLLKTGKFIFFLDGYDELKADKKGRIIKKLISFIDTYPKNYYLLTTRPYSNIDLLQTFKNLWVSKLHKGNKDIDNFIKLQLKTEPELAGKIIRSVHNDKRSKFIDSFLTNPLLLSLYILTYQSNASIPDKKYIFYRRVINALFSEHDSKTKLGFVREKKCPLTQEQFEEILKAFCFISLFESRYVFDIDYINKTFRIIKKKLAIDFDTELFVEDMKSAIALWVEDGDHLSFAHRSLQEYFAALFISNLNYIDKKRCYGKIIENFSRARGIEELENFFNLCEEIDGLNFRQYYLLPILLEARKALDVSSDNNLVGSFIKFLFSRIGVGSTHGSAINENIYRSIYIHLAHTRKLYQFVIREMRTEESEIRKAALKFAIDDKGFKYISSRKLDKALIAMFAKTKALGLAKSYLNFLEKRIKNVRSSIDNTITAEREIIDLISK